MFHDGKVEIDDRARGLIEEFSDHTQKYVTSHPLRVGNEHELFESWAIQKIASLQVHVEHLSQKVQSLTAPEEDDE